MNIDMQKHKSDSVKIDAMFFTTTEEPMVLLGDEEPGDSSSISQNDFHGIEKPKPPSNTASSKEPSKLLKNERRYLDMDTFILCNPNAMSYQQMINYPHAYYLKYFLNKQINVLVWNYRGYGRTKGSPNPENIFRDIEQVLHFVRTRIGVRGKVGIYGRSVGCTAACHLHNHVDMLIADRGFCDLWTLAEKKFYGTFAKEFFKFATNGWQANNSFNTIKQYTTNLNLLEDDASESQSAKKGENKCYKLILCDKKDEIVNFEASILCGAAREICHLQARRIGFEKDRIGILTTEECRSLI